MKRLGVTLLLIATVTPMLPLLVWAFSDTWRFPALTPQVTSLRGWRLLLNPSSEVLTGLLTSLTIGAVVTLLALMVGLPAGRALGLYEFPGKQVVRHLLLAPVLVPGLAVVLGTQVVFLHYGLADTATGVALVQLVPTVPYVVSVLAGAFGSFDVRLEQQARVLGAGPLKTLVHVTLPALRVPLTVAAYFAFLISWSEYVLTLLIGGGTVKTLPLLLFAYLNGSDLTQAAAVALLLAAPPAGLLLALRRHLGDAPVTPIGMVRL
jgi:putative spermidine/putrescine transport system permease protein